MIFWGFWEFCIFGKLFGVWEVCNFLKLALIFRILGKSLEIDVNFEGFEDFLGSLLAINVNFKDFQENCFKLT
jgi:hypothetical protein